MLSVKYEAILTRKNKIVEGERYSVYSGKLLFISVLKKWFINSSGELNLWFENGRRLSFGPNEKEYSIYNYDIQPNQ